MVTYGTQYQRDLSEKQIAKLVRQEIEADRRSGHLPAAKYSVRIGGSNTHATIDVRISELAGEVFDRDFLRLGHEKHFANQRKAGIPITRYSAPVRAAIARVEGMLEAYNFSDSGSISNVNFFSSVEVMVDVAAAREAYATARDHQLTNDRAEVRAEMRRQDTEETTMDDSNVIAFVAPVKVSEEPEQVRFMREAGLI